MASLCPIKLSEPPNQSTHIQTAYCNDPTLLLAPKRYRLDQIKIKPIKSITISLQVE